MRLIMCLPEASALRCRLGEGYPPFPIVIERIDQYCDTLLAHEVYQHRRSSLEGIGHPHVRWLRRGIDNPVALVELDTIKVLRRALPIHQPGSVVVVVTLP